MANENDEYLIVFGPPIEADEMVSIHVSGEFEKVSCPANTDIEVTLESRGRSFQLTLGELFEIIFSAIHGGESIDDA